MAALRRLVKGSFTEKEALEQRPERRSSSQGRGPGLVDLRILSCEKLSLFSKYTHSDLHVLFLFFLFFFFLFS